MVKMFGRFISFRTFSYWYLGSLKALQWRNTRYRRERQKQLQRLVRQLDAAISERMERVKASANNAPPNSSPLNSLSTAGYPIRIAGSLDRVVTFCSTPRASLKAGMKLMPACNSP